MPRFGLAPVALFCLLAFAGRALCADAHGPAAADRNLRQAEAVLSKLSRLEEADAARDPAAFRAAFKKLYPGLFVAVAELRDDELRTELATATSLYDSARRALADGAGRPDCSVEVRQSYFRLCLESADRAGLLGSEARLHTRRARSLLGYARGERDAATLDVLAEICAERSTDLALAEEALSVLKELAGGAAFFDGGVASTVGTRVSASSARAARQSSGEQTPDRLSAALEEVERLLASLPRTRVRQLLGNARDAFRDGLFWQLKTLPSRALVVSADSLADPDPLRRLDLNPDETARAALQNLRAAQRFIDRAEAAIEDSKRGPDFGE